jgi:hypothetical protein
MFSQYNIGHVLIGANAAYTSASTIPALTAGQVAIVDPFGAVVTTGSAVAGQKFRIVQGRGAGLSPRSTDLIDPVNNVIYFNANRHYNSAEQVTYVGHDTTTGSIDAQNNTRYLLRVNLIEVDRTGFAQQDVIYGGYTSDASATQWEIAREIAKNINDNTRKRIERDVKAEAIFNSAGATGSGAITGTDEVNVTFNSDIITEGSDAWTSTPAIGEVISIAGAVDVGYEVVEIIDANSVRVHMPYQGATAVDAVAVSYTATSVAGVASGIRLTGIKRRFNPTVPGHFSKVRFNTQLENFGNTSITAATAPADGNGNLEQVAKEEYFTESVFGNRYRKDHLFRATIDTDLSGATFYGSLNLRWRTPHEVSGIGAKPESNKAVKVYVGDAAADSSWSAVGVQAANLLTILNTILGTSEAYS